MYDDSDYFNLPNILREKPMAEKLIVTITGPDARKALNELIANAQFDKLNVRITVATQEKDAYKPWGSNYNRGLDK